MFTLTDSAAQGVPLTDFPAPAGRVVGEAFESALDTNPVPLFMQAQELNAARGRGYVMPKDQAEQEAKRSGVTVKVPDDGISQPALSILIQRRQDDAARELLFARSPGGVVANVGTFGASAAATFLDPINAAVGFIPVLGGTRYAAKLAEAGTAMSRLALRTGIGAAEGAVGAAALELPTLQLRRDLQDDYSLYDSLANIAFGTLASAGIRGVAGAARDAVVGLERARQIDALRAVEPEVWQQMKQQAANAQERAFWGDLEQGFQRGTGIPPELAAAFERERFSGEFNASMDEYRAQRESIVQAAEDAVQRRFARQQEKMLAAGMEPDEALKAAFAKSYPEVDRALKSQAEIGAERMSEAAQLDAMRRIAEGRGLVVVPKSEGEANRMISETTHAQALRAAVAQAVEGRVIDVAPVTHTDAVFGAERMGERDARDRARANMAPEAKVGADKGASERAIQVIEERGGSAKAKARKAAPGEKPPEHAEVEQLLSETKADFDALHEALADYKPTPAELLAHGLAKADSNDAALVAEALHLAGDRVEAAAVQFRDDEAAFLKAVKEIVGAEREKSSAKAAEGGQGDQRAAQPGSARAAEGKAAGGTGEARDPEVVRAESYARAYEALGGCAQAGGL